MIHKPEKEFKLLICLCFPLLIGTFVLFFLGDRLPYGSLFQAAGGILLVAFIFLNTRFVLSDYRYVIEDDALMVFRRQGRRETQLCSIDLHTALSLYDRATFKAQKPAHELRYNFCQNFASKNRCYFLCTFNDREEKRALLILELPREMIRTIGTYLPE